MAEEAEIKVKEKVEDIDEKIKRIATTKIATPKKRQGGGKLKPGNPKPLIDLFDKAYFNAKRAKRGKCYVATIGMFTFLSCHKHIQTCIHEIDMLDKLTPEDHKIIGTMFLKLHDTPHEDAVVFFHESVRYYIEKMAKTGELPAGLDLRATFPYQERQLILGYSPKQRK